MAVNRNPACRCALVSEPLSAMLAREHNDANVIAMGARLVGIEMAQACLAAFINTGFGGGRHQPRTDKLSNPARLSGKHPRISAQPHPPTPPMTNLRTAF